MEQIKGIVPITDKFLQNNYLMALCFREGWIFGRVVSRRLCMYKPWELIDKEGVAIDIPPGFATQGSLRFRDPRNSATDLLHLKSETDQGYAWILHGAIGLKPDFVRMYLRFPETQDIPGRFPNVDPISASAGDNFGYVTGLQSPYEIPSDFLEIVIPPKIHIGAEWYNMDESGKDHRPACNIMFMVYWFEVLSQQNHPNVIRRIALREIPSAFFTIGVGDTPLTYDKKLEKEWGETALTLETAASLGGGRRY